MVSERINPELDRTRNIAELVNLVTDLTNTAGTDIDPKLGVSWHGETTLRDVRPIIDAPDSDTEFLPSVGLTARRVADPTTGRPSDSGVVAEIDLQFHSAQLPARVMEIRYSITSWPTAPEADRYGIERQTNMLISQHANMRFPEEGSSDESPIKAGLSDPADLANMERQVGIRNVPPSEIASLSWALTEQWQAIIGS